MDASTKSLGLTRWFFSLLIGFLGSLVIWIVTPWNNFYLNNSFIADCFMPIAAIFLILVLVLIVNPILRKWFPRLTLQSPQLVILFGIYMMACIPPGQGLMRQLPYSLARTSMDVSKGKRLAASVEEMNLPPSLFPSPLKYKADYHDSWNFLNELPYKATIPWKAWIPPLLSWGVFIFFSWLLMLGISLIFFPQWKHHERLAFPLITVQQPLIEDAEEGKLFAPIFHSRGFWIAATGVFTIFLLYGGHLYLPDDIPNFPTKWNLDDMFKIGILQNVPPIIYRGQIYFIYVGIAFFMPTRVGFSTWFFTVAVAVYSTLALTFAPPLENLMFIDHREGGMLVYTVCIIWLARRHLLKTFRSLFDRDPSENAGHNRFAATFFLVGCTGVWIWLIWLGTPWLWAFFLLGIFIIMAIVVPRIVAETGMPFVSIDNDSPPLAQVLPPSIVKPISYLSYGFTHLIHGNGARTHVSTMAMHAFGLEERSTLLYQRRFAKIAMIILMIGVLASGVVHLGMNYHHSVSFDGSNSPINLWGTTRMQISLNQVLNLDSGNAMSKSYSQANHFILGGVITGLLQWACMTFPSFPLHPVGFLIASTWYAKSAWGSILIGWTLKIVLMRYGGAHLYKACKPVFIGLIVGEVMAVFFWSLVPAILMIFNRTGEYFQIWPT